MLRKLVSDKPDKKESFSKDTKADSKKNDSLKSIAAPKEKEKEKAPVKDKGKKFSPGLVAVDDQIASLERGTYDSSKIPFYLSIYLIYFFNFLLLIYLRLLENL